MNAATDMSAGRLGRDPHFLVAAGVLTLAAALGCVMAVIVPIIKKPVPWPEGVTISDSCRLTSLPARFGPYVLAEDGTLTGELDGKPDGNIVLPDDILESLGVNTSLDQSRLAERCSNWYASRVYRDTRPGRLYAFWRLEVVYYTGNELVVHEPLRCLLAGGATILDGGKSVPVVLTAPGAPSPWDGSVEWGRTRFERPGDIGVQTQQLAQYHVFCVNGMPVASTVSARLKLLSPLDRYSYFAKIEFVPHGRVADPAETDDAAADFVKHFLPHVLRALPTPEDIKAIGQGGERRTQG